MNQSINLNKDTPLDLAKLISGKLLLQAGTGGGKSFAIRRVLEQSFGKIPHIILDTEGEFASLREKFDYILIGKGYDIGADPKTAALMALRLWERRVSAIIDLYELDPEDRQRFVDAFINAMINAPKSLWKPVLLVIDEAHEYAPENEKGEYSLSMLRLASKGRKRHIAAVFATQSIASLSKRIVASCKNKLIGYASETNDVKRAAFELGMTPQEGLILRDLEPGEFYAFGPAISKKIIKLKIGPVKTTHETPATGVLKVAPPSEKVKKELAALADLPQVVEEEANTIASLKNQVRDLTQKIREKKSDPMDADKISKKAYDLGVASIKQKLALHEDAWKRLLKQWKDYIKGIKIKFPDTSPVDVPPETLNAGLFTYADAFSSVAKMPIFKNSTQYFQKDIPVHFESKEDFEKMQAKLNSVKGFAAEDMNMGKGEIAVLTAISQYGDEGLPRDSVTTITGYKRSTRDAYIKRIQNKGLIRASFGKLFVTKEGMAFLGDNFQPLPTGIELFMHLMKTLPEGEKRVLAAIKEGQITRDDISNATGYKHSTRDAYIFRLVSRQLITDTPNGFALEEKLL